MKRHLFHLVVCASLAMPLMAQEPYYPGYGYNPDSGYDTDDGTRQFNVNPGNMMNRMGNPFRNMFGSSNRRYDAYPPGGYTQPAYPPAYGYPAYPGYQTPYTGYDYPAQPPATQGYPATGGTPVAPPAQTTPRPPSRRPPPAFERVPPAAPDYQPMFANPDQATRYRFRPLEETAPHPAHAPVPQPPSEPSASLRQLEVTPPGAGYLESEPLAPLTYPEVKRYPEPLAPLSYPDAQATAPSPEVEMRDTQVDRNPNLKFRPLDKPGYSSELDE